MGDSNEDAAKPRSSTPVSTYGDKPKIVKLQADGEEYYIGSEVSKYQIWRSSNDNNHRLPVIIISKQSRETNEKNIVVVAINDEKILPSP